MSKKPSIKWREQDVELLQKTINNFNNKVYRVQKNKPDIAEYQPQRVTKTELVKGIQTRADFNRVVKSLQRYSRRGAENVKKSKRGATDTQWSVDEFNINQRRVNAQRTRERKRLGEVEVTTRGQPTGVKRKEMGSTWENGLKPSSAKFDNLSQKEWEKKKHAIDAQLDSVNMAFRKSMWKVNYIRGLENLGFYDVADIVKELDANTIIDTIKTDTEATFDFLYYDPTEWENKNDELLNTWRAAAEKSG